MTHTRTTVAGVATVAALLAGGVGAGAAWYVTGNGDDGRESASSVETESTTSKSGTDNEPTEEPTDTGYEPQPHLADLYHACADGDMLACDNLFLESPVGSAEEQFAFTCGDTKPPGTICSSPEDLEQPAPEGEVDLDSRTVEGEPAPEGIYSMIESQAMPDGAVTVIDATMIRHREVYYVVAALADTPDGEQVLTYLHEPWFQDDIGNGGQTTPLNEAAQQWGALAGASDDLEALELGDQLIVGR